MGTCRINPGLHLTLWKDICSYSTTLLCLFSKPDLLYFIVPSCFSQSYLLPSSDFLIHKYSVHLTDSGIRFSE